MASFVLSKFFSHNFNWFSWTLNPLYPHSIPKFYFYVYSQTLLHDFSDLDALFVVKLYHFVAAHMTYVFTVYGFLYLFHIYCLHVNTRMLNMFAGD